MLPAERLVAAVPGEYDLDAAARQAHDVERRDGGGVGERLVVVVGQLVQQGHRVRGDDLLDVPGAEVSAIGHLAGVGSR